jgi:hypothetical protein
MTTPDARDFVYKSPRIVGEVPDEYEGPLYYRVRNLKSPKYRFGFKDFRRATKLLSERLPGVIYYGEAGLQPGRVVDDCGVLLPEFVRPICVDVKPGCTAPDWERSFNPPLVSARVKELIERFERGKAVFIPIDARWPDGRTDRYYWFVWGKLSERATDDVVPPGWLDASNGDERFHYLSAARLAGRHFVTTSAYTVVSETMLEQLGDILTKEQVFVPVGVS